MLNRKIRTLVSVVRMVEDLLRFLETDASPRIPPKTAALPRIEVKPHDGITVIPQWQRRFEKNQETVTNGTARARFPLQDVE